MRTDDLSTVFSILRRVGTLRRLVRWRRGSDGGRSDGSDTESGGEERRRNGSGRVDVVQFLLRYSRDGLETFGERNPSDAAQSLSEKVDLGRVCSVSVAVVAVANGGGALGGRGGSGGGSGREEVAGRSGGSDGSVQFVDIFIVVVVFFQLVFVTIPFRSVGEVGEARELMRRQGQFTIS